MPDGFDSLGAIDHAIDAIAGLLHHRLGQEGVDLVVLGQKDPALDASGRRRRHSRAGRVFGRCGHG